MTVFQLAKLMPWIEESSTSGLVGNQLPRFALGYQGGAECVCAEVPHGKEDQVHGSQERCKNRSRSRARGSSCCRHRRSCCTGRWRNPDRRRKTGRPPPRPSTVGWTCCLQAAFAYQTATGCGHAKGALGEKKDRRIKDEATA